MLAPRHRKTHRRGKTKAENSISVEEPYYCNESNDDFRETARAGSHGKPCSRYPQCLILAPGLAWGAAKGLLKHHLYL